MYQHFLPRRAYLKRFLDPTAPKNKNPYLWVYERGASDWRPESPGSFGGEEDLNTVYDDAGNRSDLIEATFQPWETKFSRAMDREVMQHGPLSIGAREAIAYFIALLSIRSPAYTNDFLPKVLKDAATLDRIGAIQPALRDHLVRRMGATSTQGAATAFQALSEREQKIVRFAYALEPVDGIAKRLFGLRWTRLLTTPAAPFITSDTPVVIVAPSLNAGDLPLDSPLVEVTVPLSSTVALLAAPAPHPESIGGIDSTGVRQINERIITHAATFLVSSQRQFPGDAAVAAWARR
jgi:hypothetical protein